MPLCPFVHQKMLAVDANEIVFVFRLPPAGLDALIAAVPEKHLAHGIFFRNFRRVIGELVAHIHIERPVIAPKLPAGGHINGVKAHLVGVENCRYFRRAGVERKIPFAIQTLHLGRNIALFLYGGAVGLGLCFKGDEIASGGQLVQRNNAKIMVMGTVDGVLHGRFLLSFMLSLS